MVRYSIVSKGSECLKSDVIVTFTKTTASPAADMMEDRREEHRPFYSENGKVF